MDGRPSERKLDAPRLLHDWGRQAQVVALTMRKHEISAALGICEGCGRLPTHELPMFGLRCEIAVSEWNLAQAAMRQLIGDPPGGSQSTAPRAVGRASVGRPRGAL